MKYPIKIADKNIDLAFVYKVYKSQPWHDKEVYVVLEYYNNQPPDKIEIPFKEESLSQENQTIYNSLLQELKGIDIIRGEFKHKIGVGVSKEDTVRFLSLQTKLDDIRKENIEERTSKLINDLSLEMAQVKQVKEFTI